MANRVLLNKNGLKVSMAGINVLTASDNQLLFNSSWKTLGVAIKGVVSTNGNTATVFFGKTYPSIPELFVIYKENGIWYGMSYGYPDFSSVFQTTSGPAIKIQPTYIQFYSPSGSAIIWAYGITDVTK